MIPDRVQLKIEKEKDPKLRFLPLFFITLAALVFVPLEYIGRQNGQPKNLDIVHPAPIPSPSSSPLVVYKETLRPGGTLGEVLARHGVSAVETQKLYDQTKGVFDLKNINAGHELRIYASPEGAIVRLEYDLDEVNSLAILRGEDRFESVLKSRPVHARIDMICGTIKESPILAFNECGEGDALALAFADLFAWDVDFNIDLREGDTFKAVFEKKYLEGKFIGYGTILAAELNNQGRGLQAFYYVSPDTQKPGHYDAEGKSLEKEFRKSPIQWARVTSRFSRRRLHPIHQVYSAHYGVDYAAPVGTPAQATADGTVIFAGWNGASGRMVRIRHANAYETMYLHLRSIPAGIKPGARVKSGDVVGHVGSSGESTGPHLDYRIKQNGSYINPLSARFNPIEPLKEEFLSDFKQEIEKYRLLLADPLVFVSPGFFSH